MLAEFGLVVAQGIEKLPGQLPSILEDAENGLPALAREKLAELLEQWRYWDERVTHYDRQIAQLAAASEPAQRLMGMAGIGPLTATAGQWRASGMPRYSKAAGNLLPGWEWSRGSIRAAASSV